MSNLEKLLTFLFILIITIIGATILTYLIKIFFLGLGLMFNYPAEVLIGLILIGTAVSLIPSKKETK